MVFMPLAATSYDDDSSLDSEDDYMYHSGSQNVSHHQQSSHLDDHARQTSDIPGFKPFTIKLIMFLTLPQLILVSVLNAFYDAISQMLRKNVEKRALMDNLDGVLLAMDEIVDGG